MLQFVINTMPILMDNSVFVFGFCKKMMAKCQNAYLNDKKMRCETQLRCPIISELYSVISHDQMPKRLLSALDRLHLKLSVHRHQLKNRTIKFFLPKKCPTFKKRFRTYMGNKAFVAVHSNPYIWFLGDYAKVES